MTASSTDGAARPLAFLATVVLVAFALGGWVPVGRATKEPRPVAADPRPASDPGRAQAERAGIDVDAVVDNVRHRVTPAEDGALLAHDEQYRARFDATGFGFTLGEHPSRFGVSLRGVRRGAGSHALAPSAWRGEANVAVRDLGSGMTERVTARAGELEWDVVLERPLPGTGDLRVEAGLHGLKGVATRGTDPPAWRFPVGEGQTARMGEVVVKDATGAELHRALPQVRGDSVRLVVPASVLAGARYPLTIDPTIGPELAVGGDPVVSGQAPGVQHNPTVAWNGTNFLVVWESGSDISGARVSATGSVLDPTGLPISTAANNQTKPAVAWNGTNFLVVWEDQRAGAVFDTYGTRVSSAGSVLDPAGIPISTAAGDQRAPALASDGTNFLVVWHVYLSGLNNDLYGARVSGTGSVLDPAGLPISTAATSEGVPAVAWNGTNFLVVWEDQRSGACCDIYGARMISAGSVLDPAGIAISTALNRQRAPAVASDGTDFLVVWDDRRPNPASTDIYGARVSGTGTVLDPAGIPISTAAHSEQAPAVAWNGTTFLVVWDFIVSTYPNYDVHGARVSSAGGVLDPTGIPISTHDDMSSAPAVVSDGTNFFVVWQDWRFNACCKIFGARVNGAGTVVDPDGILLSTGANNQTEPVVAWNGTDFLVMWRDSRSPNSGLYATRVNANGTVLDPSGIFVGAFGLSPAVAWDGTNFLVGWVGGGLRGTRISAGGSVLDPGGFLIASGAPGGVGRPALAWSGGEFLVVWEKYLLDGEGEPVQSDIYGARVSSAGGVLDPAGIPISTAPNYQIGPAVAWNGSNYLVVWSDDRGTAEIYDIYGTRVSGGGSVLDPAGTPISTAANTQHSPAVAARGDSFLVVWQDHRSGTSSDIYAAGVSPGGSVAQPAGIPISTAAGNQEAPDVAVYYHFLVAWRDRRSGTNYDVSATRVKSSGVVEEPEGFVVSDGATDESAPAVTLGPGATWEVAYDRFVPESPYNARRVFMRSVSPK